MKRFIYIMLFIAAVIATSCKKFLTTQAADALTTDTYYQNADQLNTALSNVYNRFMISAYGQNGPAGQAQTMNGNFVYSDEAIQTYPSLAVNSYASYIFDYSNGAVENLWQGMYQTIFYANEISAHIGNAKADTATKNYVLAQALFLRGYAYYLLASHYGGVPMRLEDNLVSSATLAQPRATLAETYAQAVSDIEAAIPKLKSASETGTTSRISQTAAQGLLARVFLTMAGTGSISLNSPKYYDSTIYYAKQVVSSGQHALYTGKQGVTTPDSSFSYIFINEARQIANYQECMWEASFSGNDNTSTYTYTLQGCTGIFAGPPFNTQITNDAAIGFCFNSINVPKPVYDLYKTGDLRRDWSICPYYYAGTITNPQVSAAGITRTPYATNSNFVYYARPAGKWRREFETLVPKSRFSAPESFPIIRYSDVLLMLAEAELMSPSGDKTDALNNINMVRRRGYGVPVATSSAAADLTSLSISDIIDERTRELCFEGERWTDLRRWGLLQSKMTALQARMETDGLPTAADLFIGGYTNRTMGFKIGYQFIVNANASGKFMLLPIPLSEMTTNTLCTQNPGW